MAEELKVGGPKIDPAQDIMFKAACERQRKYWSTKMPELTDAQVAMTMDTLVMAINLVTSLDMADGLRSGVAYKSKLGDNLRLMFEFLQAPQPKD